ncbi:MAG: hypothetical protein K9L28_05405 [Synergistales bacterium]|nr:hypothetical protein [Synergistales bacterium]
MKSGNRPGRYDERDTLFARMAYQHGTFSHQDYYSRHPEKRETDDELRGMPPLGDPGSPTFHAFASPASEALFAFLADLHPLVHQRPLTPAADHTPEQLTRWIKGFAGQCGASSVGITELRDRHYYTHRGRHPQVYGLPPEPRLPVGIAFAVPMDLELLHTAPRAPEQLATVFGYLNAAIAGFALTYGIRALGYEARNHMDGNYLLFASPVARDAGVGVFGRHSLIMTREHGPAVRLGVVSTDMPLCLDNPDPLEDRVQAFCRHCNRCVQLCPGRAIQPSETEEGSPFCGRLDGERCFRTWRSVGTDCGVCISACPFAEGIDWRELGTCGDIGRFARRELQRYEAQYGKRPYRPDDPEWLRSR